MSSQITNNYMTTPTSPNPYITRKLNNMDEAKAFKEEQDDWTRLYHKILKGFGNNNRCVKKSIGYDEDSGRSKYDNYRNREDNSKGKH